MNIAGVNRVPYISASMLPNLGAAVSTPDSLTTQDSTLTHMDSSEHSNNQKSMQETEESLCDEDASAFHLEDLENIKKAFEILENIRMDMSLDAEATENQDEIKESVFSSYTQNLRQTAFNGSINWDGLAYEFKSFRTITPEELSDGIEYLPSRYVAILDKLKRNYTGEKLLAQRDQLEQIYQTAKNGMIENYTKFLQDNLGISDNDAQRIKGSFSTILDEKVNFYLDIITQVQEIIKQTHADNIWLKNQDTYVAEQLRAKAANIVNQTQSGAAYSVKDLTIAGQTAKKYQTEINNASDADQIETTFALVLSMIEIQTEILIQRGEVSKNMAELLQNSRVSGHESALSAFNQKFSQRDKDHMRD